MDPAADVSAGILRRRFEERRRAAESDRRAGDREAAAEQYRGAAEALSALAELRGVDRSDDIAELRRAADLLAAGEPLESAPGAATGTDAAGAADRPTGDRSGDDSDAGHGGGPRGSPGPSDGGGDDEEFRGVAESFVVSTDATWDDVGGLDPVVETVKRSVVLGAVDGTPPAAGDTKGVLLHGPPGTGKTLLASAVAGSLDTTFFEVNTGDLLSKYFGESSKQITALFEVARELAPSVVFLDEVDALTAARDDGTDGAARRVLDTLLSELDGLDDGDEFVLPLASTNTPWDLDRGIRRRFEQRIYVPLPDRAAAREIVALHTVDGGVAFEEAPPAAFLPAADSSGPDAAAADGAVPSESRASEPGDYGSPVEAVADECVRRGFSGHDIAVLCKEAVNDTIFRANEDLAARADEGDVQSLQSYDLAVPPLSPGALRRAFGTVSPSLVEDELRRFESWHEEYGTSL